MVYSIKIDENKTYKVSLVAKPVTDTQRWVQDNTIPTICHDFYISGKDYNEEYKRTLLAQARKLAENMAEGASIYGKKYNIEYSVLITETCPVGMNNSTYYFSGRKEFCRLGYGWIMRK